MIPKFRARDERGKWHVGLLTFMFGQYAIVNEADENTVYLIDKETIGQSTGLKDKNGVEIFEGDVFQGPHDFGPSGFHDRRAVVNFDVEKGYQWEYWLIDKIEVIGNIYENPELLEEAE
ncbi:TPA: hypothetical protein O2F68_002716 [Enterococcus faecalis]|jgi:uncharacterized phage protein (TIGR01671 family)|nr:hypothetical protein [Enterococcus faecalis]